jgi:hypothetical protein
MIDYAIPEEAYAILKIDYAGVIDLKNGVVDFKNSVTNTENGVIDFVNGLVDIPNSIIIYKNVAYDLLMNNSERKQYIVDMYGFDIYYLKIVYKRKFKNGFRRK